MTGCIPKRKKNVHQGKETYTLLLRDKATKLMDKGVIGFAATINVCRKKKIRERFLQVVPVVHCEWFYTNSISFSCDV